MTRLNCDVCFTPEGETLDWVWLDEECPMDIYTEALTRTNIGGGPVWMTFTPLLGMSEVVRRFLQEKSPDRVVIGMTIEEALHYSAEERQRIVDSYPPHERECRTKGIQEPQCSSASRVTAGAFGFLTFIQCAEPPQRYSEPSRFDTMPSQPSLQACLNTMSPSPS
jgi:phage terminase large subunit-like protein